MANKKNGQRKFGLGGGRHCKERKVLYGRNKCRYNVHMPKRCNMNTHLPCNRKSSLFGIKLQIFRKKIRNRIFKKAKTVWTNRKLFAEKHENEYTMTRVSVNEPFRFRISKVNDTSSEGYRLMNLELLQKHFNDISIHIATCEGARKIISRNLLPVKLTSEVKTLGMASILSAKCEGCDHIFHITTSPKVKNGTKSHYDVNMRAVWGSMVTGGGVAHLNESMATLNAPGMSQQTFSQIEQEIGDMWGCAVEEDLLANGAEERRIAMEKGSYHNGIPAITIICDGGWSKRSHKHSYNALGGVAIIIGAETGKLLHIGVRNKHCYVCNKAESTHTVPKLHRCFKNWSDSSQSMESDIILEGFLKAENTHGLRYIKVIGDGDSSVFAKLQEKVPIWGKDIEKIECANHICKCLRSSLEKLVDENPLYKGKNNIPKSVRVRLVSAVRCAIRMRSADSNKKLAGRKLEHDIRNSVHHIYGNHSKCSDFCKAVKDQTKETSHEESTNAEDIEDETVPGLISGISQLWSDTTSVELQEESRNCLNCDYDLDTLMLRDISILLDRVATKSNRLIGNHTTNLAESWMSVRAKFDGGKLYNRCNRGSWHSRCFGGCLRMNLGPKWSPRVWKKTTSSRPGYFFTKLYKKRHTALEISKKSKCTPEAKAKRWKRKYQGTRQSDSKKAKQDYGPEALDSCEDVTPEQLENMKETFLDRHINLSEEKIKSIENVTVRQSVSAVWLDERKKRVTSSNFGCIIRRNPSLPITKIVKNLLYSKFKGNFHTRKGLQEELMTVKEYKIRKGEEKKEVDVTPMGLIISRSDKYLAASPDGKVTEKCIDSDGNVENKTVEVGLLEIKNLLHSKPLNLYEAAKEVKNFCLEMKDKEISLKKNHPYYFQVQGQLNITQLPWVDFVVRTLNPYQMHIERIYVDKQLWQDTMLPKLQSFYVKVLLPELASPRNNTVKGIREPGIWFSNNAPNKKVTAQQKNKKRTSTGTTELAISGPSTSVGIKRSRRRTATKIKFVGRRISHEWVEDSSTDRRKWYNGTVISTISGNDGDKAAVYEIIYDGDDTPYSVDHLLEDFNSSSVKFIDV